MKPVSMQTKPAQTNALTDEEIIALKEKKCVALGECKAPEGTKKSEVVKKDFDPGSKKELVDGGKKLPADGGKKVSNDKKQNDGVDKKQEIIKKKLMLSPAPAGAFPKKPFNQVKASFSASDIK